MPFPKGDSDAERDSVMMTSINRSQTYPLMLPPCKPRKGLANRTWIDLGNPRPKFRTFREAADYWQEQSQQTDNKTIDRQDKAQEEEENPIQSEGNDERQGESLEDVK